MKGSAAARVRENNKVCAYIPFSRPCLEQRFRNHSTFYKTFLYFESVCSSLTQSDNSSIIYVTVKLKNNILKKKEKKT